MNLIIQYTYVFSQFFFEKVLSNRSLLFVVVYFPFFLDLSLKVLYWLMELGHWLSTPVGVATNSGVPYVETVCCFSTIFLQSDTLHFSIWLVKLKTVVCPVCQIVITDKYSFIRSIVFSSTYFLKCSSMCNTFFCSWQSATILYFFEHFVNIN